MGLQGNNPIPNKAKQIKVGNIICFIISFEVVGLDQCLWSSGMYLIIIMIQYKVNGLVKGIGLTPDSNLVTFSTPQAL